MEANGVKSIAIQGVKGSFHHIAAQLISGKNEINVVPFDDFEALVLHVLYKNDSGLMAIENSLVGSLMDNYRLLHKYQIHIGGEVFLRIRQNLLVTDSADLNSLKEVHSHPMALAQCTDFFHSYPHIKLIESEDTAQSAAKVATLNDKSIGAIASESASNIYGLKGSSQ